MVVITLPDPSIGGQAGPNTDDKTRGKTHSEDWKWNLSFVKHYRRGHISCMAKWAVYGALNGNEQFDFENNKGHFVVFLHFPASTLFPLVEVENTDHRYTLHI